MATIEDLIINQEAALELEKRNNARAHATVRAILETAKQQGRANLTPEEDEEIKHQQDAIARAKVNEAGLEHQLEISKRTKASELENDAHLADRHANPASIDRGTKPAYDRVARIGSEERTYHKGNCRAGAEFLRDVTRQFLYRDIQAEQRLSRHMQEERVERAQYMERAAGDAGTGAFAGLTVPQYLTDMYAPKVAALRPFADTCNHHDLPPNGMTINISLITTATSVALQATEQTAVSATSIDDTLLTENVQTAAGQQTLSRQAIDRGTGVEDIVMDDLFRRYATTLDSTLINQATTGLSAISTGQTYTQASPTTPLFYGQVIQAASSIETTLLGWAPPDLVVMHPRRWYSMLQAFSATWPMVAGQFNGAPPVQTLAGNDALGYAQGLRGRFANGIGICVDANVSTICSGTAITGGTQDQAYVVPSQECHLWEDPSAPVFIRAEQPAAANLGVLLVLYGYFAYTFRRFSGATININGTGMAAPTFTGV